MRRIVKALRESSRESEAKLGLSGAQLFVLQQLKGGASLSINEIAAQTLTHQSSVSVVVSRLVQKRLVARGPSPDDARKILVSLRTAGKKALKTSPTTAQETLIAALKRLPPAQKRGLGKSLSAWVKSANLEQGPAPLFFEPSRKKTKRKPPS